MDLEERTRQFVAAAGRLDTDALLANLEPDARYEFPGVLLLSGVGEVAAFLATVRRNMAAMKIAGLEPAILEVASAGPTTFAQWEIRSLRATGPVTFRGVTILRWTAEGRVSSCTVHTDGEAVRRMAVGLQALRETAA